VTIVQGPSQLLNGTYPEKFRDGIARQLRDRGVEIIFGDYIDSFPTEGKPVTTRLGRKIDADLVVPTRGGRPNTAFLKDTFGLTENGFVKIEKTLEVKGYPGVFAAGDVLDWKEQKRAFMSSLLFICAFTHAFLSPEVAKVPSHAAVIVQGVLDRLAGREPSKKYAGATEMIIITNGKNSGIAYLGILWGITLGAWFARMLKSKYVFLLPGVVHLFIDFALLRDMLIGMHKKQLGFR
jgi:NADH dehydrogenase FAD-containing subunit